MNDFSLLNRIHKRNPYLWIGLSFVLSLLSTLYLGFIAPALHHYNLLSLHVYLLSMGISFILLVSCLVYLFVRLIYLLKDIEYQSRFMASTTHELRSPVAGIQLMLETIQDQELPLDKRKYFECLMSKDLKRLRSLVDLILETIKMESTWSSPKKQSVSLNHILLETLEPYLAKAEAGGATVEVNMDPQDLQSRLNPTLFKSAIANIMDNCFKYCEGKPFVRIDVKHSKKTGFIHIIDKGYGIPQHDLKKIFKKFYRSENKLHSRKMGTGLGLYFTKLALASQGAKIRASSEGLEKGSCFKIEIPIKNGKYETKNIVS